MRLIKNLFVAQSAFLILLLLSWPLLQTAFFRMHDYTHVARLIEMVDAIRVGHLPVHWSANFGFGYGMPLFLFYGPVPFYLASIPNLIGFSPLVSIKLLILFTHFIAWLGMYSLMKRWGRTVGFVAATAFALAPYRALDLYVRGALNELFALSLLPWILHFAWLIPRNRKVGWLGLSLVTAALIASHNLTALMALPLLGLLSLVWLFWYAQDWKKDLTVLVAAFLTGGLLSAWYAIPAFFEKDLTIISDITSGYFDYHLHFLYIRQFFEADWGFGGSTYGPNDDISFHFGWVTLGLAGLSLIGVAVELLKDLQSKRRLINIWRYRPTQLLIGFTSIVLLGSLLLTTFKTQWLWDRVSLLTYVQFPWRFLAVANVLMAMLAGWGVWQWRSRVWRWPLTWLVVVLIMLSQLRFHQPQEYLERNEKYYYTDRHILRKNMSSILPDYLPITFDRDLPVVAPENRIVVESEQANTRWELNQPHQLLIFVNDNQNGGEITWNIADFPGWEYYLNDELVQPDLLPDGRRQLVTDQPIETVGALFTATPIRRWTQLASFLTFIIWLAVLLPKPKEKYVHP